MPTLVIRNPDGSEQEHELEESLSIGRAEGNDLILEEGGVSRKHARFFVEGGAVMVEDAGSANGTWVDGERISDPAEVSTKSTVVVGDYEIGLKASSKARPAPPKRQGSPRASSPQAQGRSSTKGTRVVAAIKPAAASSLAKREKAATARGPQLRGLSGPISGKVFTLRGTMVVGRVAGCDIQVDDDSVSRRHGEVTVEGREAVVRDLGSANGTTVNGEAISEDTALSAGDIIQFGIVELMFETSAGSSAGAKASSRPPVRGSGGRAPVRRSAEPDDDVAEVSTGASQVAGKGGSRKKLLIAGGAVIGLLFVMVGVKAFITPAPRTGGDPSGAGGGRVKKPPQIDPAEELDQKLTTCRTFASPETREPDWARAEEACKRVLELEPIHKEGNELMKTIVLGRACQENLKTAIGMVQAGRNEESLDEFSKVKKEGCKVYFLRALEAARAPVDEVKKQAGKECKDYASNGRWDNALKRCEAYMRLACQTMPKDELLPPGLSKISLEGPMSHTDWRPKDPNFINLLKARQRLKPGEPLLWSCPDLPVFRPPQAGDDPGKKLKDDMLKWYPDPEMGRAVSLYFDGQFQEMSSPLQKIQETMSKAALHDQARALQRDLSDAANLYQAGVTQLQNDKPMLAEEPFRKALAMDEKLVTFDLKAASADAKAKELERRKSFVRRSIIDSMSSKCYQSGKTSADRKDTLQACKLWKLGASFYRGNIDLLKALTNLCTKKAADNFRSATSCDQLKAVLEYAVDGDGFKEKVQKSMDEQGCQQ